MYFTVPLRNGFAQVAGLAARLEAERPAAPAAPLPAPPRISRSEGLVTLACAGAEVPESTERLDLKLFSKSTFEYCKPISSVVSWAIAGAT